MQAAISSIVQEYDAGRITRRELVARLTGLTALVAAASGAQESATGTPPPTFQVKAINHLALRSPYVPRARDWYRDHLGMRVTRDGESSCFLSFDQGFLAIFKGDTPGLDHFCFSIPNFNPDAVVKTLEAAGLPPERHGDRVYFNDPDGLQVQLADLEHQA